MPLLRANAIDYSLLAGAEGLSEMVEPVQDSSSAASSSSDDESGSSDSRGVARTSDTEEEEGQALANVQGSSSSSKAGEASAQYQFRTPKKVSQVRAIHLV